MDTNANNYIENQMVNTHQDDGITFRELEDVMNMNNVFAGVQYKCVKAIF